MSSETKLSAFEQGYLPRALAYAQGLDGKPLTRDGLRRELSCGSDTAMRLKRHIEETSNVPVAAKPILVETDDTNGDTRTITLPRTNIHTLEELLEYCKVDLEIWEVERFICNKWEMGYKNELGFAETIPLFQVKAFLRKKQATAQEQRAENILLEIEELKKFAKEELQDIVPLRIHDASLKLPRITGNLLEINLPDAHFGKQAWPPETGGAPYDSKITQVTYTQAIDALIERTNMYQYDRILYVIGNDILNANNVANETAHGTVVESDGRYHKTFWKARHTVAETILKLLKIAPVDVMAVYGNHDQLSSWHLADSIECLFHDNKDVRVFNTPTYRKYYEYGANMILFTHGDKGKKESYPLLMAAEQAAMFGRTKFHEVHCGHTHETKMQERNGVRVRVLPALCPADTWHAENGYVGNLRNAEAYIWNKDEGLIGTAIYNVDSHPVVATKKELV
jgi:hypothetical protein